MAIRIFNGIMEMAMAFTLLAYFGITSIPAYFYLVDGYKQENPKKGVYYLLGFFAFATVGKILITTCSIWLAMAIPVLFAGWIIVSMARKSITQKDLKQD